ncbi:MAG: methionine gamma-lyase family protein [Candidatus Gastranaerophilales bacterium]|nr:methionine gamma-lyase family protein [Candidatus Gastranaerophilales bacterium]
MDNITQIIEKAETELFDVFKKYDKIRDFNQEKVLNAFIKNKVGEEHFAYVSGYGHDDMGRETIDKVFADIFQTQSAIVRNHFVSGTHALSCVLFGLLRPGDKLVSAAGSPYDTMEEVIGKRGDTKSSLKSFNVDYEEVPLIDNNLIDLKAIEKQVDKNTTMVLIQRSRGYSTRKSLDIDTIEEIVKIIKFKNPECICFADNCYGEFVEDKEPTQAGVDIIAGSLIKNPGGSIVECGGYIAGKEELVNLSAARLTAPGIGAKGGSMLNQSRLILQGVFMAPSIVIDAIKGAVLVSKVLLDMGYKTTPDPFDKRTDIIQAIEFGRPEPLIGFCKALQASSPVNSYLTPIPDEVPGYDDRLIMAGGSFIEGSTIELSADGPLREPYVAYMQGGINYSHVKTALKNVLKEIL